MKLEAVTTPESWAKQTYYLLSNGWTAVEEHCVYGGFIRTLKSPEGKVWEASNGKPPNLGAEYYNEMLSTNKYIDLPEFAKEWRSKQWHGLVRRCFDVLWLMGVDEFKKKHNL